MKARGSFRVLFYGKGPAFSRRRRAGGQAPQGHVAAARLLRRRGQDKKGPGFILGLPKKDGNINRRLRKSNQLPD
jgi:hypothetical protein